MSLPYSYRKFFETEISASKFFLKLEKSSKIKNISFKENIIEFDFLTGFFNIKNKINLDFRQKKDGFYYEFNLHFLIQFSVILIIIFAFIISDFKNLLIFSSVIIFTVYVAVIYQISSILENVFEEILGNKIEAEKISEEQNEWMKNKDVCPACGNKLTEYDSFCPECKLNLSHQRNPKKQPVSRTGYFNYRIKYTYYKSTK